MAIRGANDNDLRVYDDEGLATNLASSTHGGSQVDYMLVDSNRKPAGDSYFPQAFLFSGSGGYDIELSANSNQLGIGTTNLSFGAGDIIDVRDMATTTGVTEYLRAVPAAGLDVRMRLHESTATSSTWVQSSLSAVAAADGGAAGGAEAFVYTPASSTWHGFVLVNNGGSGGVTVYRDTTAPTGSSVVIDGGAANTTDTSVNLALSSTDAQTGIMDMRISVDGALDSEPWEAYATSKNVTVPAVSAPRRSSLSSATTPGSLPLLSATRST